MVLKLSDICLNFIAKEFSTGMKNFDHRLLHSKHKQVLIQRLIDHDLYILPEKESKLKPPFSKNETYKELLVENFYNGHLNCAKFKFCDQVNDTFLRLVAAQKQRGNLIIKSLHIEKCTNISENGLSVLVSTYEPYLEELILINLNISFRIILKDSFKLHKLVHVDLSHCSQLNEKDVWQLCKNNSSIKILKLTYCTQVTNKGVRSALQMLSNVEYLDLEGIKSTGCDFYYDSSTLTIDLPTINFKNLKKLNFNGSFELGNSIGMKKLLEDSVKLKELNILFSSSTVNLSPLSSLNSPLRFIPLSLVSLSLYRPNIQNSSILIQSLIRLINLERLSLYCVECLNDANLIEIIEYKGGALTLLHLGGYIALPNFLTDQSLHSITKNCKKLTSISFELFSASTTLEPLQDLFQKKSTAAKFEEINLSACRNVKYDMLLQIGLNCVNLKKIDLSGLSLLVDDGLINLIARTALKLSYLDIKACVKVSDESICELAKRCPLEILVLAGLNSLTDKVIFAVANHLQFSLKEIYLSGCSRVSTVALRYLSDCCVNRLFIIHKVPNLDRNHCMAKNLDTGHFERVDI